MTQEPDAHDSVDKKVAEIFAKLAGDRANRLNGSVVASATMDAIRDALAPEYGAEKAEEIAFHMADWNGDAAFIVALHLYPEQFTPGEIASGILGFIIHAPNHIRAACGLTGQYKWIDFYD